MRRILLAFALCSPLFVGCGEDASTPKSPAPKPVPNGAAETPKADPTAATFADFSALQREELAILETVTDDATAKAAAARIEALQPRFASVGERLKKMAATPEGTKALSGATEFEQGEARVSKTLEGLQKKLSPAALAALMDAEFKARKNTLPALD